MQMGGPGGTPRQDEAFERLEAGVHRVDLTLEPVDLRLDDAQGHFAGREIVPWRRKIRTEIEQLVLDRSQHRSRRIVLDVEQGEADRAIRLVDIADRLSERMLLGDAR